MRRHSFTSRLSLLLRTQGGVQTDTPSQICLHVHVQLAHRAKCRTRIPTRLFYVTGTTSSVQVAQNRGDRRTRAHRSPDFLGLDQSVNITQRQGGP
ncbi:hypothetical protein V8C34DRAFT_106756 [Trichoderma compactum]